MISQDFLTEYELLLLRSYNKALRAAPLTRGLEGNYLDAAKARNNFINAFNAAFTTGLPTLEQELVKLGYRNPQTVTSGLARDVHTLLNGKLFEKDNNLDRRSFERLAQKLKDDVRFKY